jgi:hypothetical protein
MVNNQLRGYIARDFAPAGSRCEGKGCSKPAEYRLTVIGGSHHNVSGLFCHSCSESFTRAIENTIRILVASIEACYAVPW